MSKLEHINGIESMLKAKNIGDFLSFWLNHDLLSSDESIHVFTDYYKSYKKHFGEYIKYYYTRQTRELMHLIKESASPPDLLEIGCGCGTESLWMALNGANVTGIDITEPMVRTAKERQEIIENKILRNRLPLSFKFGSILELDIKEQYDIIFMEQAFHHIEPRGELLVKLKQLLKPGGKLLISEANAFNPLLQLNFFCERGFKTIVQCDTYIWGNERIITPVSLKRLLMKHGFGEINYTYFRALPNKKWADKFTPCDVNIPIPFIHTHYNLIAIKI